MNLTNESLISIPQTDGPERDGSTSESSLESSSGYGSQTAIAMGEDGTPLEGNKL